MTIEWIVPQGQARSITIALQSLSGEIRLSPGCIGRFVSTEVTDNVAVRYVEEWQSEAAFRDHIRSETFQKLIALIEGAIEPPRVEFLLPGGTRGLDYVQEVRRSLT